MTSTALDPADEEELLLIVSGLGYTDENPESDSVYLVGADCAECLRDMQRYLRRDDQHVMACHRALGSWGVLQKHLLPILRTCKNDPKLVFDVLKVVVKLTMKPEQLGVKMDDMLRERKKPDPIIGKQLDELKGYHRDYTRAFASEPASLRVLVNLIARPLATAEEERSEEDSMTIELVLALLVNLLHTKPPDAPPPGAGTAAAVLGDVTTLRDLLLGLEAEHGLDLVVYMLQQIDESEQFRSWNLNLLELLHYVLSSHPPSDIYGPGASINKPTAASSSAPDADTEGGSDAGGAARAGATTPGVRGGEADASTSENQRRAGGSRPSPLDSLLMQRKHEREQQVLRLHVE